MKRFLLMIAVLALAYTAVVVPLSAHMRSRPFFEKLGYIPESTVLRAVSADHKQATAAWLIWKTLFYYGGMVQINKAPALSRPDYPGIEKFIWAAARLDPYNMDAYYFGQATLVWDARRVAEANALIEYGMQYRNWDFYLPMFAGFNYAYFLKNYEKAAYYYRHAADLTGSDLFMRLSGRYLYQIGRTEQAIAYLEMMVKGARNEAIRKTLQMRLEAFRQVRVIEFARDAFRNDRGRLPNDVNELLKMGYLSAEPIDPYGGKFQIDADGHVTSTSAFALKPPASRSLKPN